MATNVTTKAKRRGRGPGKKPALFSTSLRLPKYVVDFFDQRYPHSKQAMMRQILIDFANQQGATNGTEQDPS